jgi:hypothetical protein
MYRAIFDEFLNSEDTLWVYDGDKRVFSSAKDRLLPLMEYIDTAASDHQQVVILDKIMGNAAALLSIKADCREVFSPLGSKLAIDTLDKHGIKHHLSRIVPCIERADGQDMCPMEKLSLGKGSEEFYMTMKDLIEKKR